MWCELLVAKEVEANHTLDGLGGPIVSSLCRFPWCDSGLGFILMRSLMSLNLPLMVDLDDDDDDDDDETSLVPSSVVNLSSSTMLNAPLSSRTRA